MRLIEVKNKRTKKLFHQLPKIIYKNDPNHALQLEGVLDNSFDPQKSSFFKQGEAIRWVLVNDKNKPIGRIAAFVDFEKAKTFDQPTGNIGFFECINDKEAASVLFEAAKSWLAEHGMEAMDGPANVGENYMNHGLLVMGFTPQGYGMPYNPPYYLELFEDFGFKTYYEQYSYHLDYSVPFPERFWKIAEWVAKKPQYKFEHLHWDNLDKYINDFCVIYEGAWKKHEHFKPLDPDEIRKFIHDAKMILDEEFVWLAYKDDEPIAMFVMIPDFNQALKEINGRITIWNFPKIRRFIKQKKFTRSRIILMGVSEKYQKSGIESAIFWQLDKHVMPKKPKIKEVELSWAGDFNPKIIDIYKATGAVHSKTHYQMRYLFDRDKTFERAPIITDKG